jgi:hypothetical protein
MFNKYDFFLLFELEKIRVPQKMTKQVIRAKISPTAPRDLLS